jgi:DNA invertase Pin-like site-specific DNA recombinase
LAGTPLSPGWATYLRVSDEDKQSPERSFAFQRKSIKDHLLVSPDIPFKKEYCDLLTGTTPNRKDYQQLLADAEAGRFSHLGLYRADRFGRDAVEGLQAATKLISLGIKLRVANMPTLMPETPDGFFMFLLQMGLAQREVDVLRERTRDGMDAKLRAGGWPQKAPIGYINKERQVSSNKYERWVEPDPEFHKSMVEAWELLLMGRFTLRQICDELTKRGYTRADGRLWAWDDPKTMRRHWSHNFLFKIFHNPFYAGWVVSKRFDIKMGEVRGQWEPIVTTEQFLRGLEILHKHNNEKSRPRKQDYLLRGLLWIQVGEQPLKLYGSTPTGHSQSYAYYITHDKLDGKKLHIPCSIVDNQIPEWLRAISVDPEVIPALRNIYEAEVKKVSDNNRETKISDLNRQSSQLKDEEARLGRLYITGKMSEETYNQLRREWQEKLRHLELTLAEFEREVTFHLDDLEAALALMAKMADLYPRLDKKKQGILLQILAKQIIVNSFGEIIRHELNSPFVYLQSLVQNMPTTGNGEDGSFKVRDSAYKLGQAGQNAEKVEEFVAGLRFEQRGKLEMVSINS